MKNLKFLFIMLLGASLFTSCDPDGTTDSNRPVLNLEAEDGFIAGNAEVASETSFTVKLTAAKGDAELTSLTIYEDAVKIDANRITINGEAASANAKLLFSPDTEGFTYEIAIVSHSGSSTKTYGYEVADKNGNATSLDIDISTPSVPLSLTYHGSGNPLSVQPGSLVSIKISAEKGSSQLKTIGVYQDEVLVDPYTDLTFNTTPFTSNPFDLPTADQDGFSEATIGFRAPATSGTYEYMVKVTDEDGSEEEIIVTIQSGSTIVLHEGILLNQSGPSGTGGLDLDNGAGTGSTDVAAEVRDLGGTTTWKKQIAGVDGSTLQYMIPAQNGLGENFSFSSINYKEDLAAIAENGLPFVESNELNIGDMIMVTDIDDNNNTRYFLLSVREVNETTTVGDNSDNYVFDIKF